MISDFYEMLQERLPPDLIAVPMDQQVAAQGDLKAKGSVSLLANQRTKGRLFKGIQRRQTHSKSSLFLDKKPDLLKPSTVIDTASLKPQESLLGKVGTGKGI